MTDELGAGCMVCVCVLEWGRRERGVRDSRPVWYCYFGSSWTQSEPFICRTNECLTYRDFCQTALAVEAVFNI